MGVHPILEGGVGNCLGGIFLILMSGYLIYFIFSLRLIMLPYTLEQDSAIPHELGAKLSDNAVKEHYEQLIKNGRKSIGIITKIEFLP